MTTKTRNRLEVMGKEGDIKITWDPDKKKEVKAAKETFEKLVAEDYKAFVMCEEGNKGDQLDKFDPEAERIMMVAPVVGG